jgi:hypothetical protein
MPSEKLNGRRKRTSEGKDQRVLFREVFYKAS